MAKSKVKTYPIYGETKTSDISNKIVRNVQKEIDYKAAYIKLNDDHADLKRVYKEILESTVDKAAYKEMERMYSESNHLVNSLLETTISKEQSDKLVAELTSEKKSVELLQQQIQNKDVYITRLYAVIAELNIQILKK